MSTSCSLKAAVVAAAVAVALTACGGSDNTIPQLGAATGASLTSCTDLTTRASFANTIFTAASAVPAGTLTVGGTPVPAHCQLTGRMFDRTSPVDGKGYAIGFEMRLPECLERALLLPGQRRHRRQRRHRQRHVRRRPDDERAGARFRRHQLGCRPQRGAEPDLRHRPAGPPRLRLPGCRQADADGQSGDPDRLRQGPRPLLHRRLLERRPPYTGRRVALRRPVRRLPRRRSGRGACRSLQPPTSRATRRT